MFYCNDNQNSFPGWGIPHPALQSRANLFPSLERGCDMGWELYKRNEPRSVTRVRSTQVTRTHRPGVRINSWSHGKLMSNIKIYSLPLSRSTQFHRRVGRVGSKIDKISQTRILSQNGSHEHGSPFWQEKERRTTTVHKSLRLTHLFLPIQTDNKWSNQNSFPGWGIPHPALQSRANLFPPLERGCDMGWELYKRNEPRSVTRVRSTQVTRTHRPGVRINSWSHGKLMSNIKIYSLPLSRSTHAVIEQGRLHLLLPTPKIFQLLERL